MLVAEYRARGLLIEANLLFPYLVGSLDRGLFAPHPHLNTYTAEDFALIAAFIASFELVVTTPHILTEVSNPATPALSRRLHYDFLS